MRFLFVHQNYPGQYLHIVRHLAKQGGHEIVFVSEPNKNAIPGVRRVYYNAPPLSRQNLAQGVREYDRAARRAEAVATMGHQLRQLGFTPDIIIGHHGWGELLNLPDVWPEAPLLGYFEFYYQHDGQDVGFDPEFPLAPNQLPRIRAMNVVNLLALALDQHGQTPTQWQLHRYPGWARSRIRVLPEGAHLDICKPDPQSRARPLTVGDFLIAPEHRLVTYVARNLEPYRGFHTMMRALPKLLATRPDLRVVIVGGDDVSYGARLPNSTWRAHMQRELAGTYDASRVLMPGQVPYETYLSLLRRSDAHVYLSYPFVASWSLREALACGCVVVGADVEPVREFIQDGRNGVLTDCLDPTRLADTVLDLLENPTRADRLRRGARRWAERHLDMNRHIAAFEARIAELTGK